MATVLSSLPTAAAAQVVQIIKQHKKPQRILNKRNMTQKCSTIYILSTERKRRLFSREKRPIARRLNRTIDRSKSD